MPKYQSSSARTVEQHNTQPVTHSYRSKVPSHKIPLQIDVSTLLSLKKNRIPTNLTTESSPRSVTIPFSPTKPDSLTVRHGIVKPQHLAYLALPQYTPSVGSLFKHWKPPELKKKLQGTHGPGKDDTDLEKEETRKKLNDFIIEPTRYTLNMDDHANYMLEEYLKSKELMSRMSETGHNMYIRKKFKEIIDERGDEKVDEKEANKLMRVFALPQPSATDRLKPSPKMSPVYEPTLNSLSQHRLSTLSNRSPKTSSRLIQTEYTSAPKTPYQQPHRPSTVRLSAESLKSLEELTKETAQTTQVKVKYFKDKIGLDKHFQAQREQEAVLKMLSNHKHNEVVGLLV